jgi:hypothetical protein
MTWHLRAGREANGLYCSAALSCGGDAGDRRLRAVVVPKLFSIEHWLRRVISLIED